MAIVHSHAAAEVLKVRQELHAHEDMSTASKQLAAANQELKWLSFTPDSEMSNYEVEKKNALLDDKQYWTTRVREIEARKLKD
jgi:hypothetical protein